jgi:hypothetical protein
MTSQGTGKKSKASANHKPSCEEIRLRAYEIYLERGGLPGIELDDWLQAERKLQGPGPQEGELADQIYRRT